MRKNNWAAITAALFLTACSNSQAEIKTYKDPFAGRSALDVSDAVSRIEANDPQPGYYFVGVYNFNFFLDKNKPARMLVFNEKGEAVWQKKVLGFDFKPHKLANGKLRFTYLEHVPGGRFADLESGVVPSELVVLDENLAELKRTRLLPFKDRVESYPVDMHDALFFNDNHYIVMAYYPMQAENIPDSVPHKPNAGIVACIVQEIKNDQVVFEWNSSDFPELYGISREENDFFNLKKPYADYAHLNSIRLDPKDNNIILSFRNIDSVLKVDRSTGQTLWRLGGTLDQFGLTEQQKFSRQHDASFLSNGNLLLFDNGNANKRTRILEMSLNQTDKGVRVFNDVPTGLSLYALAMGNVNKLDDSRYMIGWGALTKTEDPNFSEIDAQTGQIKFSMYFKEPYATYRAYKLEF